MNSILEGATRCHSDRVSVILFDELTGASQNTSILLDIRTCMRKENHLQFLRMHKQEKS